MSTNHASPSGAFGSYPRRNFSFSLAPDFQDLICNAKGYVYHQLPHSFLSFMPWPFIPNHLHHSLIKKEIRPMQIYTLDPSLPLTHFTIHFIHLLSMKTRFDQKCTTLVADNLGETPFGLHHKGGKILLCAERQKGLHKEKQIIIK